MIKNLFGKELCNTGRQIEFDIAKTVCILGMVFVHCFEELATPATEAGASYYIVTIVIDALFGAATFMSAMGLGIAYSLKEGQDGAKALMKRGIKIFIFGYILGFIRFGLPELLFGIYGSKYKFVVLDSCCSDIMPFAGMALFLFGLLKSLKFSDKAILYIALGMSVVGSFVRLINVESPFASIFGGLFFGFVCENYPLYGAAFPLFTWFVFVIGGYYYGKILRHCRDVHKYYSITLPVSAVILVIYMLIAIPKQLGMMNEDIYHYYQMTTFDAVFCFIGMIFATSVYHFISLALSDKIKSIIQKISSNINRTYCIHWVIIGFLNTYLLSIDKELGFPVPVLFILGCVIYVVSNLLAELYTKHFKKKKTYQ